MVFSGTTPRSRNEYRQQYDDAQRCTPLNTSTPWINCAIWCSIYANGYNNCRNAHSRLELLLSSRLSSFYILDLTHTRYILSHHMCHNAPRNDRLGCYVYEAHSSVEHYWADEMRPSDQEVDSCFWGHEKRTWLPYWSKNNSSCRDGR